MRLKTKLLEEYYSIQKNIDNEVLTINKVSLENKIKELNNKILEYENLINKNKFKMNTTQELSNVLLTKEYDIAVVSELGDCVMDIEVAKKIGKKFI
jgi:hypothetical protein